MERKKIEALIDELKENFVKLDLRSSYNVAEDKRCVDLSMQILLPECWQKVKWAVDVCNRYGLENTTENSLLLAEGCLRSLAKHILSEKKYHSVTEQHPSIH